MTRFPPLWVPPFRGAAAVCLTLLMLAMFPANIYGTLNGIEFNGVAPEPLLQRAFVEILWIGAAIAVATEPAKPEDEKLPVSAIEATD